MTLFCTPLSCLRCGVPHVSLPEYSLLCARCVAGGAECGATCWPATRRGKLGAEMGRLLRSSGARVLERVGRLALRSPERCTFPRRIGVLSG